MIALFCLCLALFVSPFKSKRRLEAENAALRHQLIVLRRKVRLIRDRDRAYGAAVTRRLRAMGIRDKPIAPGSPWQNGFAERLIGSIRRECVDLGCRLRFPPSIDSAA
jgi:transposase InsO family protein